MPEPLLAARGLSKRYGALAALDGVSIDVLPGEVHAVIGPNGAGKTTLIGALTGEIRPEAGAVLLDGAPVTALPAHRRARLGLARSFQITSLFLDMSVLDNVALAVQLGTGHSFRLWRPARRDPRLTEPARAALDKVGLGRRAGELAAELSHGEHRQLEIAVSIATEPRLLLLDEPMAGLGPEESRRMVELLHGFKGRLGMLLVEHDMDAVYALADRVSVLVYGKVIATGTPAAIRADPKVREAYLGDAAVAP